MYTKFLKKIYSFDLVYHIKKYMFLTKKVYQKFTLKLDFFGKCTFNKVYDNTHTHTHPYTHTHTYIGQLYISDIGYDYLSYFKRYLTCFTRYSITYFLTFKFLYSNYLSKNKYFRIFFCWI